MEAPSVMQSLLSREGGGEWERVAGRREKSGN